jgi:GNAT superfamily N-acetyltransferase
MCPPVNNVPRMSSPPHGGPLPARSVRLRDGKSYCLRQLRPGDLPILRQFFRHLSPASLHQRYGFLSGEPASARAHTLLAKPRPDECLLGIFEPAASPRPPRLRALGELAPARHDPRAAECAFLVDEATRRLGMASRLLLYLRVVGRRRGLARLCAQVDRANLPMREVFHRQGARLHFGPDTDYVEIDLPVPRAKFLFDKPREAPSFRVMVSSEKKPFSFASLVADLVLVAVAFVIFYALVNSHVPSNDPAMIKLWGGLTAACMSGVFWLAWQMVKVVYRFQRESRK